MSASSPLPEHSLARRVQDVTGVSPRVCYQCGRCAAGCPQNVDGEMDLTPTQVLRLLQLDAAQANGHGPTPHAQRLLGSDTPWLCFGCQACTTRCPQGVDIAGTMDVLRQEAMERKVASRSSRARRVQALHKLFVQGATSRGRIHELSLVGFYKLKTLDPLTDAMLGPQLFLKGKLHLLPPKGVDTSRVQRAAEAARQYLRSRHQADHHETH